jgi:HEAT repeat protein
LVAVGVVDLCRVIERYVALENLRSDDEELAQKAVQYFEGSNGRAAIDDLFSEYQKFPLVRHRILEIVSTSAPCEGRLFEAAIRAACDPVDWLLAEKAVRILMAATHQCPGLASFLLSEAKNNVDAEIRWRAVMILAEYGHSEDIAAEIAHRLIDSNALVRRSACKALGKMNVRSGVLLDAVLRCLTDGDTLVRSLASWALGNIAVDDIRAVRGLLDRLADQDDCVFRAAAESLGAMTTTKEVVDTLSKIADADIGRSQVAVRVLANVSNADELVVPVLKRALASRSSTCRIEAARGLIRILGDNVDDNVKSIPHEEMEQFPIGNNDTYRSYFSVPLRYPSDRSRT